MTTNTAPNCGLCNSMFKTIEQLNNHMMKVHHESDDDRMVRLTVTFQSPLVKAKHEKDSSCCECGEVFKTTTEQEYHNRKYHGGNGVIEGNDEENSDFFKSKVEKIENHICELCDKVFPNEVHMTN